MKRFPHSYLDKLPPTDVRNWERLIRSCDYLNNVQKKLIIDVLISQDYWLLASKILKESNDKELFTWFEGIIIENHLKPWIEDRNQYQKDKPYIAQLEFPHVPNHKKLDIYEFTQTISNLG